MLILARRSASSDPPLKTFKTIINETVGSFSKNADDLAEFTNVVVIRGCDNQ